MKQHTKDILNQWNLLKPLRDAVKDKLYHKFSLEFNFNSNHIEGNTLTYGQTEALLLFGKVIGEAKMKDLEEMKAHNIGLKMVLEEAMTSNPLTETFIRQLHKKMLFHAGLCRHTKTPNLRMQQTRLVALVPAM